jgi:hypothetical protein
MELAHDRKHSEHLLCDVRSPPPVFPAEGDLRDLLPRAEAIVSRATRKAPLPQTLVNAAAKVRLQMRTGNSGIFVDREVR